MRYDLYDCEVQVDTRKRQLELLWGCIIGFTKNLPVDVYRGDLTLLDNGEQIVEQLIEQRIQRHNPS